ncbi:ribonuclease HIII ['Cynodon dactylon' phytoplasma]|uniref:ribonuclease HIII n=1 Tax='Cynodon dactylon' phytoplasma TaxID=295320 RepID=UPI001FCEBC77|nr:ribonuclease HIII ['Cynodon dactylon' phytoplasma]
MSENYILKKLNLEQIELIRKEFQNFILNEKENKSIYVLFRIKKDNSTITIFKNGTCFVQGLNKKPIFIFICNLLNLHFNDEVYDLKKKENHDLIKHNFIGSDEVGTGDIFGPIIVCASFVSEKNIAFLKKMNITDSKKLSSKNIFKISKLIINKNKIPYFVKILHPLEYNSLIQNKNNLNKIKALLHNEAILELIKKIDKNVKFNVVIDQFAIPEKYFNYLKKEKIVYKDIIFCTKAETKYLSVAVSSILARYFFLKEIQQLSEKLSIDLKLGASFKVDQQLLEICEKKGFDILNRIAKCNFKNIKKLLNNLKRKV